MVLAGPRARARCALRVTKSVPDYLDRVSLVVEIPDGTLCWEVPTIPSFAGDTLLEERPIMFAIAYFRHRRRPGSVLLPALFVVLVITAEGQVRAADGHIVRRRVQSGGAGGGPTLFSLFDTAAIFAFSTSTSTSAPAWSMGGSCSAVGGCGSNGLLYGNGGPAITGG